MNIDTATTFFALLALAVQLFLVAVLIAAAAPSLRTRMVRGLGPLAFVGATAIAAVSMLGSLYLSEVAHFIPCKLCWYQRIAMYPTALVLVVAAARRDRSIRPYAIGLCVVGALIALYHALIERFPSLESSTCDPTNPCSLKWVEKFGFVTIPVMALSGFLAIIALLFIDRATRRLDATPE
jgi:disulfide bond formation protein DsbB